MARDERVRARRGLTPAAALVAGIAAVLSLGLAPAAPASGDPSALASTGASSSAAAAGSAGVVAPAPVLAYYYMWFNSASWSHAKADQPALGGYTSTDPAVIRQQVTWARQSGIDAFIVSWKNTPSLDLALQGLVAEAHAQGLKLVLIYEGLDVNRNPISADTVMGDLIWFEKTYGQDPAFDLYGKPAVIWSGTWRFSDADIARVRAAVDAPNQLLLLGSEKSDQAYTPRAQLFDGDAYYWSSADPLSTPGYAARLNALGRAVHARGGLWLAPAPVGFDARLNGGTSVVDRRDGGTLSAAWSVARASGADGMAVISWNEYTEGSYIEPSEQYGFRYLSALASLTGAAGPSSTSIPSLLAATGASSASEDVGGETAAGSGNGTGAAAAGGQNPARPRPQPIDSSPYAILVAAGIVLVLVLVGLRLRVAWRREVADERDGP